MLSKNLLTSQAAMAASERKSNPFSTNNLAVIAISAHWVLALAPT
jgi:hypothetical protein